MEKGIQRGTDEASYELKTKLLVLDRGSLRIILDARRTLERLQPELVHRTVQVVRSLHVRGSF